MGHQSRLRNARRDLRGGDLMPRDTRGITRRNFDRCHVLAVDDDGVRRTFGPRYQPTKGESRITIYRLTPAAHVRKGSLGPAEMAIRGKAARRLLAAQAAFHAAASL